MHVAAIIVAAGKGERAGGEQPKQFVDLGDGRTMLDLSIDAFLSCSDVDEVVVAVPPGFADRVRPSARVHIVEGGARRQDSMANAFARVALHTDVVLVHDAARPFVTRDLIARTVAAAHQYGAAIAALPVRDTVKRTHTVQGARTIRETLPRDDIFLAQTPQGFRRDILGDALAAGAETAVTDEAMLVERTGIPVHIVEGDFANVKVTTRHDLWQASQRLGVAGIGVPVLSDGVSGPSPGRRDVSAMMRIGTGYDLHRLVAGRPLVLAGVRIPFDRGLHGHSDADLVCHAVIDAILGAAALGDIGRLFPDTDATWKDADSIHLLQRAVGLIRDGGFQVGNIDVTVIAERPKLLPYVEVMRTNLARALGIDVALVSIKGKTNETVDAAGRGEAMACHAVALITGIRRP